MVNICITFIFTPFNIIQSTIMFLNGIIKQYNIRSEFHIIRVPMTYSFFIIVVLCIIFNFSI